MARGGKREGKPGVVHSNRTDLNAPPVNFDGGYGTDVAQAPMQANRVAPRPVAAPPTAPAGPAPGSLTPLDAPTMRPNEPLTAGLPIGPGPGPEALGMADGPAQVLRAIYMAERDESIRELLEALDEGR